MKIDLWVYADKDVVDLLEEKTSFLDFEVPLEEELKKLLGVEDIDITLRSIISYSEEPVLRAFWSGERDWVGPFLKGLSDERRKELFTAVAIIIDPLSQELIKKAVE